MTSNTVPRTITCRCGQLARFAANAMCGCAEFVCGNGHLSRDPQCQCDGEA